MSHGCEDPVCPLCRSETFTVRKYHLVIRIFDWPVALAVGCLLASAGELLLLPLWVTALAAILGALPIMFTIFSSLWCERCEHEHGLIEPLE